jgi:ABC-type Na+ efflux pump permease subunit
MGLISFMLGVIIGVYLTVMKWVYNEDLAERPLLWFAILLVMVGVQLVTMGLLAEMIARTYHESQNKPIYSVREELG